MDDEVVIPITWRHFIWDVIVFTAVIVSLASVCLEVLYDFSEEELSFLFTIDILAISIFILDLMNLWRYYNGPFKSFLYRNYLDFLSAIPIFRIFRIARFARVLKLTRFRRLNKLKRITEAKEIMEEKKKI